MEQNCAGNFTGYYGFLKGFHGLADIPTILQGKKTNTGKRTPSLLDDIIVVTKGSKQKHMDELIDVPTKVENAEYSLGENKSELLKIELEWIGHNIDQNGIRPLLDKLLAIKSAEKKT